MYYHHPRPRVLLYPVHNIIYPDEYLVQAFPRGLTIWRFPLRAGWAIEPHSVFAFLVTCGVGLFIVLSFHPVAGQLQVLAGILVDIV
jgi:hypothetical protein